MNEEVIGAEAREAVVQEMGRVFNLSVGSACRQATHPWIAGMPGEAIGYVL